tara:strand:+ start:249 stop:503 length:255 start_codon:yes stop_codon:yes gene_type:complete
MIIDAMNSNALMLAINRKGPIGDKSNNLPPIAVATKIPIAPKKELKPITVPRCLRGASWPMRLAVAITVPMALHEIKIKIGRLE